MPCRPHSRTHSRSSNVLASPSDATAREAAYRASAHTHLSSSRGKSNSSSPPHQAPPPVVSALRAVQAVRPHTQPQQQRTRFSQRCHCPRGRVPCFRTRAPLLFEGQEQQLPLLLEGQEPQLKPSSPSTTTCGECSARCAGRKATHTAAAAVHSLLPAMPLPEGPRTVLSHTRNSTPRGARATAPSPRARATARALFAKHHHLW